MTNRPPLDRRRSQDLSEFPDETIYYPRVEPEPMWFYTTPHGRTTRSHFYEMWKKKPKWEKVVINDVI